MKFCVEPSHSFQDFSWYHCSFIPNRGCFTNANKDSWTFLKIIPPYCRMFRNVVECFGMFILTMLNKFRGQKVKKDKIWGIWNLTNSFIIVETCLQFEANVQGVESSITFEITFYYCGFLEIRIHSILEMSEILS